jgi:autotransporter-associated beta strand protein
MTVAAGNLALRGPISGAGSLVKAGPGPLRLYGTNAYAGDTVVKSGTVQLLNSGSLDQSSQVRIEAAGELDASGRNNGSLTLAPGQTLTGNGVLRGNVIVGSGARLVPGISIGTLSFSNALTLLPGSLTVVELMRSPATNDQIRVAGPLIYGGSLEVVNLGANALAAGDSFQLFNAASYSGGFANVSPPIPGPGLLWDTSALDTNGTLRIVAGNLPRMDRLQLVGNTVIISGTGGTLGLAGGSYFILKTVDLSVPIAQWARIATNQFDFGGGFHFTNLVAPTGAAFYLLQLP